MVAELDCTMPVIIIPANDKKLIDGIFFRIKITRKTGRFERSEDQVFFCS